MKFDIFPLNEKATYYKTKMERATNKKEIVEELGAACCYAIHVYMNSGALHRKVPELLRALDKVCRSVVFASDGIQDGFRLSDFWFHTIFAQILIKESEHSGKTDEALENMRQLFQTIGWNYDDSIEPMYNEITTLETIEYFRKYSDDDKTEETGELKIILFPTSDNPIGARWVSSSGRWYVHIGQGEYEPEQPDSDGLYRTIKPTDFQRSKWSRVI